MSQGLVRSRTGLGAAVGFVALTVLAPFNAGAQEPAEEGAPTSSPSSSAATTAPAPREVTCQQNAQYIAGDEGTTTAIVCPAGCADGRVWGTAIYSDDSSMCRAAIHAGVIDAEGGVVTVTIHGGQSSYEASVANGVHSEMWGPWRRSFVVSGAEDENSEAAPATSD